MSALMSSKDTATLTKEALLFFIMPETLQRYNYTVFTDLLASNV